MANATSAAADAPDALISQSSALEYWSSVSPDVSGMLGGIPTVSRIDLQGSANFLAKLRRTRTGTTQRKTRASGSASDAEPAVDSSESDLLERAVDCGAGIGRITKGLLIKHARVVDIVEPVKKFADEIPNQLGEDFGKIGTIHNIGLESWVPDKTYDLIWNQWCLGQLTDMQLNDYLVRIQKHLKAGGWIVVKENLSNHPQNHDIFDEVDSSVTRSDIKLRLIFEQAGLKIVATELQRGFPKDLYAVRTYALHPQ